ncbi:type II 3-dehydroquinate dehydratase [Streptomyces sp. NPDC002920]
MATILLVNGPDLGALGRRESETSGTATLQDIEKWVAEEVSEAGWDVRSVQSNSEGDLVGAVQDGHDTGRGSQPGSTHDRRLEPARRPRELPAPLDRGTPFQCLGQGGPSG